MRKIETARWLTGPDGTYEPSISITVNLEENIPIDEYLRELDEAYVSVNAALRRRRNRLDREKHQHLVELMNAGSDEGTDAEDEE